MSKLAILIIHGQGSPEPSYADALEARLKKRLGALWDDVAFEPCHWADILQNHQDDIWGKLLQTPDLGYKQWRHWIVSALGDPPSYLAGYFKSPDPTDKPVYSDVHERVRKSLEKLEGAVGGATPLMVLAPSLGSIIVSNYFWDESQGNGIGTTPFERMERLTSLITYGSTIPLFLPPTSSIECIAFPSPSLPEKFVNVAQWINVFDQHDVLGYPLEHIWDVLHGTQIHDMTIDAGPFWLSWTPLSHSEYEGDDDFLDIVRGEAETILAVP